MQMVSVRSVQSTKYQIQQKKIKSAWWRSVANGKELQKKQLAKIVINTKELKDLMERHVAKINVKQIKSLHYKVHAKTVVHIQNLRV